MSHSMAPQVVKSYTDFKHLLPMFVEAERLDILVKDRNNRDKYVFSEQEAKLTVNIAEIEIVNDTNEINHNITKFLFHFFSCVAI